MTTASVIDNTEIDHIVASEQYRLQTFDSLTHFPLLTRRQLALAGFIYRQSECLCPQCGIEINLEGINENSEYESNHFRKLHRKKVSFLGKRCSFLLCESGTNIDDLHTSLSSPQQPQWDDAEEPDYINYTTRLQSFETWPGLQQQKDEGIQKTFVTPQAMAKHGFYFSGPRDGATCFYCGNTLIDWSSAIRSTNENIVQLEHARFFPCRFVTYTAGGKFVANAGYFHTVSAQERRERNPMISKSPPNSANTERKPRTIDECLATFENWPRYAPVSAQALADTGFYYLGVDLRVRCFMCDLEVEDWRHGMTALGTHRKRNNNCQIVRAIDSIKTGDIQTVNEKWRLETLIGLSFDETKSNDRNQTETDQRLCRELAACGFYRYKNTKIIRCAYCGITIEPKPGQSIMSQHRHLTKQSIRRTSFSITNDHQQRSSTVDCLMVRAQCPANIVISHRERFPEYPLYQSIFDRIKTFDKHKERHKTVESSIRNMAEAGFFLDEQRRMRCFQCGNALPVSEKVRQEKYPQYNMAQLHAHFYPTCEWVKELLGVKYIAQVLHDRYQSNEPQTQTSFNAQASSGSSSHTTMSSFTSTSATPAVIDVTSPSSSNRFDEPFLSDHSADSSDDEGFQTVARPPTTERIGSQIVVRSPFPVSALSHESLTTENAQTCSDPISSGSKLTSPLGTSQINPFKQLVLQQQRSDHTGDNISLSDNGSNELSPLFASSLAISSPVDIRSLLAHESNRLDSFKKQNRETFAKVNVGYLAYVGFYLNGEGTVIQCPWCEIKLTEQEFEDIMRTRPSVTRSTLGDEPWTPMRVHRHANGLRMDHDHPWCTWVRREAGGLYPNVTMIESQMLYPEYPSYSKIEKRIQSFTSDWVYPSGSRLSNQIMAEAGFFYMGGGSVCCYYCGNKLQNFEPRDCPFEEHATFYPLCDFIQKVRGLDYINRIILECGRIPQGRLKYEMDGTQKIKRIIFDKSGATKRKSERPPVNRINSYSSRSTNRNHSRLETIDNACLICTENAATHEYDPCRHFPICGECFARLDQEYLQKCMHCFQPATIRMRTPNTPLIQ
ncbi:unnamed protein product [Adineta steineri]|uniref:Uncharacterized protein n=2 Tax=Adineta steineri TaxID=433720 RepID=A0A818U349_9BILA|nr:unnamed protein product [Adineta steineri]CAF3692419.1 unnamed protein product [Adineta steineri]